MTTDRRKTPTTIINTVELHRQLSVPGEYRPSWIKQKRKESEKRAKELLHYESILCDGSGKIKIEVTCQYCSGTGQNLMGHGECVVCEGRKVLDNDARNCQGCDACEGRLRDIEEGVDKVIDSDQTITSKPKER